MQQNQDPLEQVTFTNISASNLTHLITDNAYRELYNIVNHNEEPDDQRETLMAFIQKTRKRFLQLLVVLKWLKLYGHETLVRDSTSVLQTAVGHQNCILEAQDLLFFLHHKLFSTHQGPFDMFSAMQLLSNGDSYRKSFPGAIERCGQETKLKIPPNKETVSRLNHLIRLHLLLGEAPPAAFTSCTIQDGALTLSAGKEFELVLTLEGEGPDFPWTLLKASVLLGGLAPDPAEGTPRRLRPDRRQEDYLHHALIRAMTAAQEALQLQAADEAGAESRTAAEPKEVVAGPLEVAYCLMHEFCTTLQLEILHEQAQILARGMWKGKLHVHYNRPNKVMDFEIWESPSPYDDLNGLKKDENGASPCLETVNGVPAPKKNWTSKFIRIFCNENINQDLCFLLGPVMAKEVAEQEEKLTIPNGQLGASQILLAAIQIFAKEKLLYLANELRLMFEQEAPDRDFAAMSVAFNAISNVLEISGATETTVPLTVDARTGDVRVALSSAPGGAQGATAAAAAAATARRARALEVALAALPPAGHPARARPGAFAVIGAKIKLLLASVLLEEIEQTALLSLGIKASRAVCLADRPGGGGGGGGGGGRRRRPPAGGGATDGAAAAAAAAPSGGGGGGGGNRGHVEEDPDLRTYLPLGATLEQGPARPVAQGSTDEHAQFFLQVTASGPVSVVFHTIMAVRPLASPALTSSVALSHLVPHRAKLHPAGGGGGGPGGRPPRGPRGRAPPAAPAPAPAVGSKRPREPPPGAAGAGGEEEGGKGAAAAAGGPAAGGVLAAMLGEAAGFAHRALPFYQIWRGLILEQDNEFSGGDGSLQVTFEDHETLGSESTSGKRLTFPIAWESVSEASIQKIQAKKLCGGGWEWHIEFHSDLFNRHKNSIYGQGILHRSDFEYGGTYSVELCDNHFNSSGSESGKYPGHRLTLILRYAAGPLSGGGGGPRRRPPPPAQMAARGAVAVAVRGLRAMAGLCARAAAAAAAAGGGAEFVAQQINLYQIQLVVADREVKIFHSAFHIDHCILAGSSESLGFKIEFPGESHLNTHKSIEDIQVKLDDGAEFSVIIQKIQEFLVVVSKNS